MKVESLAVGPFVGHNTATTARIWGRGAQDETEDRKRCYGVIRHRKQGGRFGAPSYFKMTANFDFSGITEIAGLDPATDYEVEIGYLHTADTPTGSHDWSEASKGSFTTTSGKADTVSFVFGSCRYLLRLFGGEFFDDRSDKAFLSVIKQMESGTKTDLLLMVGDQIYADDLNILHADQTWKAFSDRYCSAFSQPHIRNLMSRVPTYMTLDDHEIENDWPREASPADFMSKYPNAIHAYEIYQASHGPALNFKDGRPQGPFEHYWYSFSSGCADFFVMDSRTERLLEEEEADREMISEEQMAAFKSWLTDGSGQVKLVASSVPFFPDNKRPGADKWDGFLHQRTDILNHIRLNKVKKVVFLSGDIHLSLCASLVCRNDPGFKIYSVISFAFFWPYFQWRSRKGYQEPGDTLRVLASNEYRIGEVSEITKKDNFTRVTVTRTKLTAEVYERKGELLFRHEFKF